MKRNEKKIDIVFRNVIWGLIYRILLMILPFISRTVMIYTLGNIYVGLDSLFASVLQVLNLSELGISSAVVYAMYKPVANGDTAEVCALLNFYKKCYMVIGLVIGILGIAITPLIRFFIVGELPRDVNIYTVYIIVLFNLVLSYEYLPYSESVFIATQRRDVVSRIRAVLDCTQLIIQIVCLYTLKNYYLFIFICVITTLLNNSIIRLVQKKYFPLYKCYGDIKGELKEGIIKNVKGMLFTRIGYIILVQADTIIISMFLGLETLGLYQNYYYVITALAGILQMITDSVVPTVGNSIVTDSKKSNYDQFKILNFVYVWIVSWFSACLFVLWIPFMKIWIGDMAVLSFGFITTMIVCFYVHRSQDVLGIYQYACGLWWETRWIPFIAAVVNLSLNIILVNILGLYGIVISTIVSIVIVYIPGFCHVLYHNYFREEAEEKEFYKMFIRSAVVFAVESIITIAVSWFADCLIRGQIYRFIAKILIVVIIPNLVMMALNFGNECFKTSYRIFKEMLYNRIVEKEEL